MVARPGDRAGPIVGGPALQLGQHDHKEKRDDDCTGIDDHSPGRQKGRSREEEEPRGGQYHRSEPETRCGSDRDWQSS